MWYLLFKVCFGTLLSSTLSAIFSSPTAIPSLSTGPFSLGLHKNNKKKLKYKTTTTHIFLDPQPTPITKYKEKDISFLLYSPTTISHSFLSTPQCSFCYHHWMAAVQKPPKKFAKFCQYLSGRGTLVSSDSQRNLCHLKT